MIFKQKSAEKAIEQLNKYLDAADFADRTKYVSVLHEAFPYLDAESKEKILIDTLSFFPETIAYAMLKLSIKNIDIEGLFRNEYKSSMESFMEDIETDLVIAFGDPELFLTYAKLYVLGLNGMSDSLKKKISVRFMQMKCSREYDEQRNKATFK